MKLFRDHAYTGKLVEMIEKIKTRKYINTDINTCKMMYHSVTVPFSQYRISNFQH